MGSLLLTVMVIGFGLLALTIVMVVVSARADQAITIKGPLATLGELEAQIRGKSTTLDDLEAELEKRRGAISSISDIQAEVDSLLRQKDELLAEWQQLEERRQEVLAMRQETEDAQSALADVTRDLSEKSSELEKVEARLKRAEELVGQISQLEEDHNRLEQTVSNLREELANLQTLKAREEELREKIEKLERDITRVEAEIEGFDRRREEAEEAARIAESRLEELKADYTDEAARVASTQTELSRMEAQRAELLAQIETYKDKAGISGNKKAADPLCELNALPPVLKDLNTWDTHAQEQENEALHRVSNHMKAHGLDYHTRVIRAFHTAMKVNETTQMAVLAGISGTGKSQLPRRYAQAMGIGFLQVPVQPRWDSPQDLMGFYNYIEGQFRPTDLARSLYHLDAFNGPAESSDLQDRMMLVLLDEMNLARVEYYFSDFLSRLESRPGIDETNRSEARKDAELELDIPMPEGQTTPRIFPGYNVLFAGTMNEDESTQSLSDKVVDRANVMRFAAPKSIKAGTPQGKPADSKALTRTQWRKWVRGINALAEDQSRVEMHVERMVEYMTKLGRPFGHRLGRSIMAYAANYPEDNGRRDIQTALADQVEMRLLPKLRGIEMENASTELQELSNYVERELSDPVLADAIRHSAEVAEDGTGQFTWRGVTRG
ncbi:hypothetical protein [Ruegeria profundi]|uniref:Chromosome segregation ATPase-like protein n=1 Tax=Ruegeria profundi TaxID=1685378 RepID=A0A0X3TPY7_9RHOB|nr:hypothetical protein [Ruegeria profundi]KUJ77784.1 hypothetical protein AVO44_15775 [Ruegeria profundi]